MKLLKGLSFAFLLVFVAASCSKDHDDTPPPFAMEGFWSGKIGTGSASPSGQYALNLKSGGIIERVNGSGAVTATGTWQLNGAAFTASYNYTNGTMVNVTGTVDKGKNKLTANWENNGGEKGSLYASKE
jgi:hypothetical protein